MDALTLLGWTVYDLAQPRATMQTPGLPDLYVVGFGVAAWLEVKRPKGKQSDAQTLFEQVVRENGAIYQVVRSEEEAVRWSEDVRKGRAA